MALRLIESFDGIASTDMATGKWTSVVGGSIGSSSGRFSGSGWRGANNAGGQFSITLDNQATWIVGFGIRTAGLPGTYFLQIRDTTFGTQVDLRINGDGSIAVTRNGTTLGTSVIGLILVNVYNYIELKTTINNTTGSYDVHLNGVSVLSATGVNTRAGSNNYANQITFGLPGNAANQTDWDDIYIFDGTGSVNNDFAGDCKVEARFPSAAGSSTVWTPNTGSNWDAVNDATSDGDTTYVASSTPGDIDLYAVQDLAMTAGTVKGVQISTFMRKDDAGTRQARALLRPGSTNYAGTTRTLSASYVYGVDIWETNPDTTITWTLSEFNATQVGIEEIA